VKLKGALTLVQGEEPILDQNVRSITLDCNGRLNSRTALLQAPHSTHLFLLAA